MQDASLIKLQPTNGEEPELQKKPVPSVGSVLPASSAIAQEKAIVEYTDKIDE